MELKQGLDMTTITASVSKQREAIKANPLKTPVHTTPLKTAFCGTKEVGEVEDSSNSRETSLMVTVCSQCQGNLRVELQEPNDYNIQTKYHDIVQENDVLRQGMLEILEKLREYDGKQTHTCHKA